jgi:hypothetical protein
MSSHLDKYILPRFGSMPIAAIDEKRVQEFIVEMTHVEHKWPNGISKRLSPKTIINVVGVLKVILGEGYGVTGNSPCLRSQSRNNGVLVRMRCAL